MTSAIERALSREWFYSFRLPDGRATRSYLPDEVATIHETRLAMIESVLDAGADRPPSEMTCLDLACHEGFFAVHMALRGFGDVLGIDVRPANIEGARLMREIYGLDNLRLEEGDVATLQADRLGRFDVVLVLGLIYHLADPVGALRLARAVTAGLFLVETQIAHNLSGAIDWGSYRFQQRIVGAYAVVDEQREVAEANREANTQSVSLVPSLEALLFTMRSVGFARVDIVAPPAGGNEQFARGKRVMVCARPE